MVTWESRAEIKILVPGAGLARLAWEVVRMGKCCSRGRESRGGLTSTSPTGFSTQANEFSLYMVQLFVPSFLPDTSR